MLYVLFLTEGVLLGLGIVQTDSVPNVGVIWAIPSRV